MAVLTEHLAFLGTLVHLFAVVTVLGTRIGVVSLIVVVNLASVAHGFRGNE
jgi:hypothetical protein